MLFSHHHRPSRRRFLGFASAIAAGGAMVSAARRPVTVDARPYGKTQVSRVTRDLTKSAESDVITASAPFSSIGLAWTGPADHVQIRWQTPARWSDWLDLGAHSSGEPKRNPGRMFAELLYTGPASAFQLRWSGASPGVVTADLIDAGETPQASNARLAQGAVLLRNDWGCDEDLRYDPATDEELWPVEYRNVEKIIVHHTVTANEETDWAKVVRSIYYFHTITQGYGDIGYNLLIDPNGRVYEGRAGGPGAVGGHALGYNAGSAGIAFLGTFSNRLVSTEAQSAFASIVSASFGQLAPFSTSYFNDKTLPNICGHRDCLQTECPGTLGYKQLPVLRDAVAVAEGKARKQVQLLGARFFRAGAAGELIRAEIDVWNNSSATIDTQSPDPGFIYNERDNSASIGAPGEYDAWRVGIDFLDNTTGKIYPYRWGLGRTLAPGEKTTVIGQVRLNQAKNTQWWAGLVQEGVAYRTEWYGASRVSVTPVNARLSLPAVSKGRPLN